MNTKATTPIVAGRSLDVGFGDVRVLQRLAIDIQAGTITALVGPNGSGKSTLLRTLARLLRPSAGAVYIDGEAIAGISPAAVARRLAMLPQGPSSPDTLRVIELVEQGRYPHVGPLRMLRRQDHAAIGEALHLTHMTAFAQRPMSQLSGGERQRAWIAAALAQSTPLLLLDEPTTFLDVRYQLEVLELIARLNRDKGLAVVMALHDLNHAARYADRIVALRQGTIVADGPPGAVLTESLLESVFGVRSSMLRDPATGSIVCVPYAAINAPNGDGKGM